MRREQKALTVNRSYLGKVVNDADVEMGRYDEGFFGGTGEDRVTRLSRRTQDEAMEMLGVDHRISET